MTTELQYSRNHIEAIKKQTSLIFAGFSKRGPSTLYYVSCFIVFGVYVTSCHIHYLTTVMFENDPRLLAFSSLISLFSIRQHNISTGIEAPNVNVINEL